jgi:hypothetical protein
MRLIVTHAGLLLKIHIVTAPGLTNILKFPAPLQNCPDASNSTVIWFYEFKLSKTVLVLMQFLPPSE